MCEAIKLHTTGGQAMTMLDKILYVSDAIRKRQNMGRRRTSAQNSTRKHRQRMPISTKHGNQRTHRKKQNDTPKQHPSKKRNTKNYVKVFPNP